MSLTRKDYPLSETRPESIASQTGRPLSSLTLDAVERGEVAMADLRIAPATLVAQAQIARDAGRATLAQNFERASELVNIPEEELLALYELLRPGRARDKQDLLAAAERLRSHYGAARMAEFIAEAASVYEARGLFTRRF